MRRWRMEEELGNSRYSPVWVTMHVIGSWFLGPATVSGRPTLEERCHSVWLPWATEYVWNDHDLTRPQIRIQRLLSFLFETTNIAFNHLNNAAVTQHETTCSSPPDPWFIVPYSLFLRSSPACAFVFPHNVARLGSRRYLAHVRSCSLIASSVTCLTNFSSLLLCLLLVQTCRPTSTSPTSPRLTRSVRRHLPPPPFFYTAFSTLLS